MNKDVIEAAFHLEEDNFDILTGEENMKKTMKRCRYVRFHQWKGKEGSLIGFWFTELPQGTKDLIGLGICSITSNLKSLI